MRHQDLKKYTGVKNIMIFFCTLLHVKYSGCLKRGALNEIEIDDTFHLGIEQK